MISWEQFQRRCSLEPKILAIGQSQGKGGDYCNLDPGFTFDQLALLKQLKETQHLLRLHRLRHERLQWSFLRGTLLAQCEQDRMLYLLTPMLLQETEVLWRFFDEG